MAYRTRTHGVGTTGAVIRQEYISLISLRDILNDIGLGKIVYALYLKEYQIQPLSYSKMGVELYIGENTSITDTL